MGRLLQSWRRLPIAHAWLQGSCFLSPSRYLQLRCGLPPHEHFYATASSVRQVQLERSMRRSHIAAHMKLLSEDGNSPQISTLRSLDHTPVIPLDLCWLRPSNCLNLSVES